MNLRGKASSQNKVSRNMTPLLPTTAFPHLDQRKHIRYKAREGALVSLVGADIKYWKVLDVSLGGLSFQYIPYLDINGLTKIDLVTQNLDFALDSIPFKVVSNTEFTGGWTSFFPIVKRCGVRFRTLTDKQRSLLEQFIGKHTLP